MPLRSHTPNQSYRTHTIKHAANILSAGFRHQETGQTPWYDLQKNLAVHTIRERTVNLIRQSNPKCELPDTAIATARTVFRHSSSEQDINKIRCPFIPQRCGHLFQRQSVSLAAPEKRARPTPRQRSGNNRNRPMPRPAARVSSPGTARPSAELRPGLRSAAGIRAGLARYRSSQLGSADPDSRETDSVEYLAPLRDGLAHGSPDATALIAKQ
jgi:hypothetical protein